MAGSFTRAGAIALGFVLTFGGVVHAQIVIDCDGISLPPADGGQWVGPFMLEEITDEHPAHPIGEIAHLVLVPGGHDQGVLFWCQAVRIEDLVNPAPGHETAPGVFDWGPTHMWRWVPSSPTNVVKIDVPNNSNGSEDLFCGGQALDHLGRLWVFGGTDVPATLASGTTGHGSAWLFHPRDEVWSSAFSLTVARWYPAGLLVRDLFEANPITQLLVLGHEEGPVLTPLQQYLHDRLDLGVATPSFVQHENRLRGGAGNECGPVLLEYVDGYPRCHVLAHSGKLFVRSFVSGVTTIRNAFLNFQTNCAAPAPDRWEVHTQSAAETHDEGTQVHFVTFDSGTQSFEDTVYTIAGQSEASGAILGVVRKITNPDVGVDWDDSGVADLSYAREYHNAVILADGSLFVPGGQEGIDGNGKPIPVWCPELYLPPEVFPGATDQWFVMNAQAHGRIYHSVACLLPDRRVVSAGGRYTDPYGIQGDSSHHSVEIYQPPYLFKGPRPVISNVSSTIWEYSPAQLPSFDVAVRPGRTIERIHLIRNGTVTHGFDSNQRYVQLRFNPPSGSPPYTIQITPPDDTDQAPEGYYLLFVVDDLGVPSEGVWIHMEV